jgi:PST family polysaccharide transporter
MSMSKNSSYGQILKSTAIIGSTQVINILIGIVRVKALALFLGPTGIGLAGMYQAATGMIGTLAGLGLGSAGVRQIAEAAGSGDNHRMARTIAVLRRASWVSGLLGMGLVLIFAKPLARTTFGNDSYAGGVALVSLTLLFGSISAGQTALLQGLRRLKDLAACNLLGSLFGTVASIALVYFLRERGVAPFLVTVAGFGILTSWWYARKVQVERITLPWRESFQEARPLLIIGASFLAMGLIAAGVAYLIPIMIIHELGIGAVGLYTASSNLSLLYIGVVINAMGADFYPRLTAIANHHREANELVNQQAEMGILLTLPGLMATILLAPWVMRIFYSAQFVSAAELIRWQILGMGLRVACWPLGYISLAKGMSKTLVGIEAVSSLVEIALIYFCIHLWGLEGCGIGFAIFMALAMANMTLVSYKITGFKWAGRSSLALVTSIGFTGALLLAIRFAPGNLGLAIGAVLTAAATAWSISNLNRALGTDIVTALRERILSRSKAEAPKVEAPEAR